MRICIDAGHYGKYNRSPVVPAYWESEMTWKLHLMLKEELEAFGALVVTTRNSQTADMGLEARGRKAKGCDLFFSVHSNACNDASVDYPLACCCVHGELDELGEKMARKVAEVMGTRQTGRIFHRKGAGGDYYGVLRGAASVGVAGILMEHGFHTNAKCAEWLMDDDNLRKLAKAEAEVIAEHYGLNAVEDAPKEDSGEFKPYLVQVTCDGLNIRKTPAWGDDDIVGVITDHGVYTIVAETTVDGTRFGKLKSGAGWISLAPGYAKKFK